MKTILVTGSAGFIGFHTAKRLLDGGYKVIGLDNFNSYYDVDLKEARTGILQEYPNFILARGDIDDVEFVRSVFETHTVDTVCHLAAQAGVRYSLKYPYAYISNLTGFLHIINEAKNFGVQNFIFASSSSVYGEQSKSLFNENLVTDSPMSLYAATKKSDELIARSYHHLFGMKCIGLRFFTVYGTYGRPDMAIFDFTKSILANKSITLFNNGHMKRSFTHVDDIVDGIIKSVEADMKWGIMNLGSDRSIELHYLVELLEKNLQKTATKEYLPLQPGDVPETQADIKKARKELGWEPKVDIENGIKEFVSWYMNYYPQESKQAAEQVAQAQFIPSGHPKVSVLMSVYNGAEHLREAIESILSQTFTNFEFLIVDDCSNDNSPAILKEYADKDKRICLITNEFNLGLTKNLNKMVNEARGEYLARFDCDDVSLPQRFEEQVKFLDAHPRVGMVSLWADIIDGQGAFMRTLKYPTTDKDLRVALIQYNPFFHPGLMMRKVAIVEAGLYDESWRFAQDYELYFRIAKKWELANVPAVLLNYREDGGSITGSKNRKQVGFVLKAKKKAIREGQYSKWNYLHLLRSYISWLIPVGIKRFFKRLFLNKKKW